MGLGPNEKTWSDLTKNHHPVRKERILTMLTILMVDVAPSSCSYGGVWSSKDDSLPLIYPPLGKLLTCQDVDPPEVYTDVRWYIYPALRWTLALFVSLFVCLSVTGRVFAVMSIISSWAFTIRLNKSTFYTEFCEDNWFKWRHLQKYWLHFHLIWFLT